MSIVDVTSQNLDREHICCAKSDNKGEYCMSAKKDWLKNRFAEGLVFKKLNEGGKVFIEYIPAEKAWCPIIAPNYMFINCFWVSGQFKGQGYATQLLEQCITDAKAKGKSGLTVLSSQKKLPFLSDPGYLKHKGFLVADRALPSFELLYLPFEDSTIVPKLKPCTKVNGMAEKGLVLYYSHQCPYTVKYAPLIAEVASRRGVKIELKNIETTQQAQNAPTPWTTYSLFRDGSFVTNEILSEKKFEKLLEEWGI